MSTSISLTVDTGGPHPVTVWDEGRFTDDQARLARDCGFDLDFLDGCGAGDCLTDMEAAARSMSLMGSGRAAVTGDWGAFGALVPKLRDLAEALRTHPLRR